MRAILSGAPRLAWLALATAGLLSACATAVPPATSGGETLSGRLTLRVEPTSTSDARALTAAFELRGDATQGALDLNTPLGTTIARARWAPSSVVLLTSDGERRFTDLDSLTREALGESVPVAALFDWLQGRPWPGAESGPAPEPIRQGFTQLGWSVDLSRFDQGALAAARSRAPAVSLRARLDR